MVGGGDPLTGWEREEFEGDLISFCDRELDLLGDISGLRVLYAGGSSPLWIEGLAQRAGPDGSITVLDMDAQKIEASRELLRDADLPATVRLVAGDVFDPPFDPGTFDLAYSAGLFHELDVRAGSASDALAALASTVRPGGRLATGDFVDTGEEPPAAQIQEEALEADMAREETGAVLYGIGPPEGLVALHREVLDGVRWRVLPPFAVRHMGKLVLGELVRGPLAGRSGVLRERISREGYTRPATLFVEGVVRGGGGVI